MTDVTASDIFRPGKSDGSLFLTQYAGEVLTAFREFTVMEGRFIARSISNGQSKQFPVLGRVSGTHAAIGKDVLDNANGMLQVAQVAEKVITVDRPFVVPTFVDDFEELVNHWDIRGPIAQEQGQAIAEDRDSKLMRCLALAAQSGGYFASPDVDDHPYGTIIQGDSTAQAGSDSQPEIRVESAAASADTQGAALAECLRIASEVMTSKRVPRRGRYCLVKPAQFNLLVEQTDFTNVDLGNGGNGSLKEGRIGRMWGFDVIETNLLPTTNLSAIANTNQGAQYAVDARNTVALCGQTSALGGLRLRGLETMVKDLRATHEGWLLKSRVITGYDWLRPSAAVQIRTALPV